jgi:hypothetical protein
MPVSTSIAGEGATFAFGGEVLGNLISVSFSIQNTSVDRTHMTSDIREKRPSQIPNPGTSTVVLHLDMDTGSNHLDVLAAIETPAEGSCEVVFSNGDNVSWDGFPTSYDVSAEIDSEVELTINFENTSFPVFSDNPSS